jgi:DNA topoisomerase-3
MATSQAKDVRAAVGSRYGDILPAEGHLFDLLEPEDVVPAWKRWSPILLRPDGLYDTCPAEGGNKAAKLKAIREALRTARRVWLATDCDREGQLIGQEILEHYKFHGQVMRVLFTAQDSQTIRAAFGRAKPNTEYARLYAAAVARRQADQIYNLSLTRTATVILGRGARGVIGVGRVKTPTLAIVCKRELEIRNFVPFAYFEVVATAKVAGGQFQMRHAPQDRIVRREIAQKVANAAQDFDGALAVRVEDKRQGPPKLHDLPSLQKLCASRFGWAAAKTLEVAQELYDGQGKKIVTYPRAEVRYLPQSLISDVLGSWPDCGSANRSAQSPCPTRQSSARVRAAVSTTRGSRVLATTPSFPTLTRSTTCGRSGLAFRLTRRNCSTSSRGRI